ncbi:aminopeptidase N [Litorihabitans aurantiacus]|uniref:Aminopeptidase N n=1 Tax=Litorihabitans aurantiacus TaxID=1930061 RepID=A0AA37XEM6_9MICO|nr:aminopeptidase N [Litorihabitans aurantiacus]GMA31908.1 aminopeptidase N [Litorihabitans aurantiacus]
MPGENLTRAEAQQRAAVVTTHHYEVALDLTRGEKEFGSRTLARFDAEPGSSTFIDLIAPSVQRVTLNGRDLDVAQVFADSRIQLDDLAASNELVVEASCAYMHTGEGLHRFVDPVDGEVYLYSQFEVADTRRVFAVFEQPDLKATFAFTVTAPSHWRVISNSPTPEPVAAGDDTATWTFEPTVVLPCYVTAIIAGPYTGGDGELVSSDGRTIPLGVYCRASLAEHLDVAEILDVTRRGFAFYEEQFDYPYPYAKYDQIFVPEFNAGAMENAGAVTFLENYVFRSKVTDAMIERRAVTILHELAHMWFGDLVTMKWWNDLWLNESFAEYASTLATAEATRWTNAWTTFASLEKSWAYKQDQLPSTHPIVAEISDLEDVEVNFDGITYAKGASVLRQLVAWVGAEEFMTGVAAYFKAHAHGNTELPDLLRELERTSGRDLSGWSGVWLEKAGVTLLRPELGTTTGEDGVRRISSLAITQEAPQDWPTLRPHRLAIGGYDVDGAGALVRRLHLELDVDGARTPVTAWDGEVAPDLLLVNDGDLAYAKIRLDDASLAAALSSLRGFTDSLPRTLVWGAAWDMTRDGEWPARRFVDLVLGNIDAETDSTVVMVLLRQLNQAIGEFVDPRVRGEVGERAADRLWELTTAAAPGSDAQLQFAKAYALRARTAQQLDRLAALRDGSLEVAGLAIDVDLRWELLTALVAGGAAGEDEIAAELERDATASGERAAAGARAAIATPEAKEAVWARVVAADELPNALQMATVLGFARTHDRTLTVPFVERYFAALETVWAERTNEMAQNVVTWLYPSWLADLDDSFGVDVPGLTDTWLAQLGERTPALRRLVVEAADGVRRALAVQAVDRQQA